MSDTTSADLIYSATDRCPCGAGLAYPNAEGYAKFTDRDDSPFKMASYWDCSAIMLGTADPKVQHTAQLPFTFYKVKGEGQPSAHGATTRPTDG